MFWRISCPALAHPFLPLPSYPPPPLIIHPVDPVPAPVLLTQTLCQFDLLPRQHTAPRLYPERILKSAFQCPFHMIDIITSAIQKLLKCDHPVPCALNTICQVFCGVLKHPVHLIKTKIQQETTVYQHRTVKPPLCIP